MPVTPEQARAELARRRAARRQPQSREDYIGARIQDRDRYRLGPVDVAPFIDPLATEENRQDSARGLRRGLRGARNWLNDEALESAEPRLRAHSGPRTGASPMSDEAFERWAGQSIADEIVIAPSAQDREQRNRDYRTERRANALRGVREGVGAVSNWAQQQSLERPWLSPQDAMLAEAGEVTFDFLREPWRAYERGAQGRDEARFEGREDDAADQALANIGQSSLAALSVWPGSRAVRAGGDAAARGLRALPGAVRAAGARVTRPQLPAAAREAAEASGQGEFRTMMGIDPTRPITPRQRRLSDLLAALPTKLERLTAEEYAAVAARHPWFRHARTGAPLPARIDLVRLSNARAPDGRFLHSEDAVANFTGYTSPTVVRTTRALARDADVPVAMRSTGTGGATRAPGGEQLAAIMRVMERAERNGEYLRPVDIAARLNMPDRHVNVVLSQVRRGTGARAIPPEVMTRFRALDAAQQARRNAGRQRRVDDTLGWLATGGAWTTAGALAASNDAEARELDPEVQQQLEQARAELQSQQEQIRRFEDLSARAANDPGAARELQAIIGAVPDGRFGPQTAAAARARADQMRNDLGEMERRRQNLEESQMMARVSVTPEEEAQRELLLTSGAAAGALLGKYGLPIPTRLPFFGRFSGALGRSGTARHVRERLAERVGRAEAVQFMERPFGRRSLNQDQRAAERAATVNDFWREGLESGDQARVPFLMGSSEAQRPLANRNARSASQLFQPPRFSGEDFGYMAMGGLDAGIAGALLPGAQQKLEDAERAFESDRSEVNLRAVEEARASVTRLEIALRVGAGYIGGRVVGGYTDHYAGAPRPRNLRAAEAEQGRISRYVAPAEQRPRGRPKPR